MEVQDLRRDLRGVEDQDLYRPYQQYLEKSGIAVEYN